MIRFISQDLLYVHKIGAKSDSEVSPDKSLLATNTFISKLKQSLYQGQRMKKEERGRLLTISYYDIVCLLIKIW